MLKEVMTTQEVADYLRVNPKALKRMVERGQIKATTPNTSYTFTREEVERFIRDNHEETEK